MHAKTVASRTVAILVAIVLALSFTVIVPSKNAEAAQKKWYFAKYTQSNTKIAYSGFKQNLTQTWPKFGSDLSGYKDALAYINDEIAEGATEYWGDVDMSVMFGTVKMKASAKVKAGKLTTKAPKYNAAAFLEKPNKIQSVYKKWKKGLAKAPIKYAALDYAVEKNHPDITITIGSESFALFQAGDITLNKVGKVTTKKTSMSGKYTVGVSINCKSSVTNEQMAKFYTALTSLQDGDTVTYSFTTPTLKTKATTYAEGPVTAKAAITYKGINSISNKKFTVTETIKF